MKSWLPSGKTLGVCLTAIALALWSLPNTPDPNSTSDLHTGSSISSGAIPTMAVPVEGPAQPNQSPPQNQTPSRPQPPSNAVNPAAPKAKPGDPTEPTNKFSPYVPIPKSKLRIRVIDGRTERPIEGAEVVLIETEQRFKTGPDGFTQWMDAPVLRDPRYRPLVAELHGQLGAIAYRNGYRDSIQLGIRVHDGVRNETTIWMYRLGPGDRRIEPVLYQVPYHRLWLIELADRFRSKSQPGEGPERP
ncbi:hypothetical protein [Alicyclobacillus pomorum]|uniref:hypothetical protein n=1 Tax=Alicyclobacillus pomorum TaxID=204470 RepID=UPI00040C1973|nr:hypothetical protein [Alicyclobacillus pomorum]